MPEILHLHDIVVTLCKQDIDLPPDMQLSAQLIVDGYVFVQTVRMGSETSGNCWKLRVDCQLPHVVTFLVVIIYYSKTKGTRLLGSVSVRTDRALVSVEQKIPLCQELSKLNVDGPSLELRATFSIARSSTTEPHVLGILENQVSSLDGQIVWTCLKQLLDNTQRGIQISFLECWVMYERILLLSDANINRGQLLNALGRICFEQWKRCHIIEDLNQAVCAYEDAVLEDPMEATYFGDVGVALNTRFAQLGDFIDLNKCVSMQETGVSLTSDGHPNKPEMLNNLAGFLHTRFERLGDLSDLTKSVSVQEAVVSLTPDGHPSKPLRLNNLANSLCTRFEHLGDSVDLSKSLLILEAVICQTPDGHPNKPSMLSNLGSALQNRFKRLGDLGDLNRSVSIQEAIVDLTSDKDSDKPARLSYLGSCLLNRFEHLGDPNDLKKSVSMQEAAIALTPNGHSDKPSMLNNLGNSLLRCFEHFGELDELNKLVSIHEDVVNLTPDGLPGKPSMLNNLGSALQNRFERLGDLDDLNRSVSIQEAAVGLTPDEHPDKPARLGNLGSFLLNRFKQIGDLSDLDRSVSTHEAAVGLIPDGHSDKPMMLSNLGSSISYRFDRLGDLGDLEKSISIYNNALSLIPDGHSGKPSMLSNLSSSFARRFEHLDDIDDLNKSVSMNEDAVRLIPDEHPSKGPMLSNLGRSLYQRFEKLNHTGDLNRAVSAYQDAVDMIPDGQFDKPALLNNLGSLLSRRFELYGDPNDLLQTITQYSAAACSTTGPASVRFHAASVWADQARVAQHSSLLDACGAALDVLPELAWLGLSITDRHYHIMKAGSVVRDAAAAAIASNQPEKAVQWLEQGHSIIWGQLLNLRTPVDVLKQKHPKLADKLIYLSAQLEGAGTREQIDPKIMSSRTPESPQMIAQKAHENAHKRAKLLKEIRELEGFDQFLLPKTLSELSLAAQKGPVVFLNHSSICCDALILQPHHDNRVMHVPLTEFTVQHAETLSQSFGNLLPSSGRNDRFYGKREGSLLPEDEFAYILSELWVRLVKPVLDALGIMTPNRDCPQRMWWCLPGPLIFLPIHAAGLYGKDDTFGSKLSDFVVSSYTPSLTALIEGFRPRPALEENAQLLAIAQPSAVGQVYIPGTKAELNHIQSHASGKLPVLRLEGHKATVESVQKSMKDSSWVHFACHGVQDASDPTKSALFLAGSERLTLSSIINLSLPHANFAFLSACQTATGDKKLGGESVHLAAGMLSAGFRSIIATMWTIMDSDASQVADNVYEHLFKTSPPDSTQAAEALHIAVRRLREESSGKKSFYHWAPYIHVGI